MIIKKRNLPKEMEYKRYNISFEADLHDFGETDDVSQYIKDALRAYGFIKNIDICTCSISKNPPQVKIVKKRKKPVVVELPPIPEEYTTGC